MAQRVTRRPKWRILIFVQGDVNPDTYASKWSPTYQARSKLPLGRWRSACPVRGSQLADASNLVLANSAASALGSFICRVMSLIDILAVEAVAAADRNE